LNKIKSLFRKQLIDQIGFVITKDNENDILRRYIIEFHQILDHSLNTLHQNGNYFLGELDSIFSTCIIELMRQIPISPLSLSEETHHDDHEEIHWKLQIRLCHKENNKFENIDNIFYEQFKLIDNIQMSLKQIKSVHCQRLNLQLMCQNKI
jgi:hypothetical protein